MDLTELKRKWGSKVGELRAILKQNGTDKPLADAAFEKYLGVEDGADSIAGRISQTTGAVFGPRIEAEWSRAERLQARESYAANHVPRPEPMLQQARDWNHGPFGSFGEQLQAVVRAGTPGQQTDSRLYESRAASGLSEGVGAEGGFAVQTDFSARLLQAGIEASRLASRCNPFPIGAGSNSIDLPMADETSRATGSRFGGLQLGWASEGGALSASKPKLKKLHLEPKKLGGICYLTDELVQDAAVLERFVRQAFQSEFGWVVDDAILNGSGVGQPLGLMNSTALITVAKEGSQAAATLQWENCIKMYSRITPGSEGTAVWLINKSVFPQLVSMSLAVGTGGIPVYSPGDVGAPGGIGGGVRSLLGLPIIWLEQAATLGTTGDIVLADFSRYLLSTKGQLRTDSSIHVRFIYDESVLRFVYRVDGQPDMSSAVSPAHGSSTLSPFVTLATRA